MKKALLLFIWIIIGVTNMYAQKIPEGMKYQAVARTATGEILANHTITLRINLKAAPAKGSRIFYSEDHVVTTNQFGLFDIVVGEGKNNMGVFAAIPWSSEDVWLAVSLKDKGADFSAITESRLLAVPYAFHALTANRIVENATPGNTTNISLLSATTTTGNFPGVPANVWSLQGNYNSNPLTDKLGTTDVTDLVMVTSNIERLRIKANGDIFIKRTLSIGANLNVDSSVYLNRVSGSTINYGPFKVDRLSPTLLSGTLTVDGAAVLNTSLTVNGPTDLNSRLFVNNLSPTKLTGTLQVDGTTNLNAAVSVNNLSPTLLTGTLRVNLPALFKDTVLLDNTRASNSITTGALVVAGGLGLGGNFNVGGASTFAGPVTFGSAVNITDLTQSTSTTTGALIVGGGIGIGKRLNVGEGGLFAGSLGVAGITSLTNTTESSAITNGALIVAGGAAIAKSLNIGAALNVAGATTLNNTLQVNANADGFYAAQFNNAADANGILIKIGTGQANSNNKFITFQDNTGKTVGRIEGQTLTELHNDADYQLDLAGKSYDVISGAIDVGLGTYNLVQAVAFQIEADASVNACAGFGVVACPPIASFVAGSIVDVVVAGIEEALVISSVVIASTNLGLFVTSRESSVGVTYQSGSGDYAEFLMKQQVGEKIYAGDIVGVKGGKISKNIEGAEKIMVVSHKPIVLGNTPIEGTEGNYEKVAFMGQVPVKVFGKVNLGDYIIPNGVNNGVGIAVAPDKIKSADVKNIVGIAWSTADNTLALSNVIVAIGLNVNDNQKLIEAQQNEIEELKNQIASTNSQLEKLIPGFKAPANKMPVNAATYKMGGSKNTAQLITPDNSPMTLPNLGYPKLAANEVHYVEISKQDLEQGFVLAEEKLNAKGNTVKYEKFWKKYKTEPGYKEFILNKLMKKYNEELANHKALDARLNH